MRTFFLSAGVLFLLMSCSSDNGSNSDRSLSHSVAPENLSARMALRVIDDQGERKTMAIIIHNPEHIPVQSVRAWVRFDPASVFLSDLAMQDGRFTLFAPGERDIDPVEGFVKIGAAVRSPIRDSFFTIATFTMESAEADPVLSFYDWREDGDGHTAVLTISEEGIRNILQTPPLIEL